MATGDGPRKPADVHSLVFAHLKEGCAHCRMIYQGGRAVDWVYLEVNPAFEASTGLKNVVGRKVSEVIAGIRETSPDVFQVYGRVASTGHPETFETYVESLGRWLFIDVFRPARDEFVAIFKDITAEKSAKDAAQASEGQFHALFDHSPDPVSLSDLATGELIHVNQAWCDLTGYPAGQALGRTAKDLGLWSELQDRDRFYKLLEEKNAVDQLQVTWSPRRGGDPLHVVISARIHTFQGRPCVHLVTKDLTAVHRSALALQASETRYRGLFDLSPDGICLIRVKDQTLVEVNRAWERFMGTTRQEVVGRTTADLGYYQDLDQRETIYRGLPDSGDIPRRMITVRRTDGSLFDAQVTGRVLMIDGEQILVAVIRDVSGEVSTQKALERQLLRYSKLMATSRDAIHVVDMHGRLIEWNPAFLEHLGYTEEEAGGLVVSDWDLKFSPEEITKMVNSLVDSSRSFETLHRRKDGTVRTVEINATGITLDGQNRILASARDMTERKQMEESLREAKALVEAVVESTPDMIWSVDAERFRLLSFNHGLSDYFLNELGCASGSGWAWRTYSRPAPRSSGGANSIAAR